MLTPKETNYEIKTKEDIFLPVSDVDIEESCFYFNIEFQIPCQEFLDFF